MNFHFRYLLQHRMQHFSRSWNMLQPRLTAVLAVILTAVVLFLPAGLPGRMKSDEAWGGWRSKSPL